MGEVKKNVFYNPDAGKKVTKRHLPHWQQENKLYFVTFRLADSIPAERLEKLREDQECFVRENSRPYSEEQEREYQYLFFEKMDSWLDNCYGQCLLEQRGVVKIVKESLEYYDDDKYWIDYWVIMPNHVHVIILLGEGQNLKSITHGWKSYTANKINKLVGRNGQLWQHESFDHIIRRRFYLEKYRNYIISNMEKAGSRAMLSTKVIAGL